jgi:hypothetical protein
MKLNRHGVVALGLGFLTLTLAGCGGGGASATKEFDPSSPHGRHIIQMAGLIGAYKTAHKGKPPGVADELKNWIQGLPPAEKDKIKFEGSIDEAVVSPRDKEPYQIAPAPTGRHAMGPPRIVVYEKSGVRGKHMVASGMGTVSELDQKTIDSILSPQ